MPAEVLERPVVVANTLRRFEVPDIDHHFWMISLFKKAYPHLEERAIPGWLRSVVYQNDYLALYQENSVGLAQAVRPDPFTPRLVVWERFVWVKDPKDAAHLAEASLFYERFKRWAKDQDAEALVVGTCSDVPVDMIKAKVGRLVERKQLYATV
jgi:hypothetical protein